MYIYLGYVVAANKKQSQRLPKVAEVTRKKHKLSYYLEQKLNLIFEFMH